MYSNDIAHLSEAQVVGEGMGMGEGEGEAEDKDGLYNMALDTWMKQ